MTAKEEYEQLYKDSTKLLQVLGTVFAFVLFVEINLLSLGLQIATRYKQVPIPTFQGVFFLGGISIILMSIALFTSYIKGLKPNHIRGLIEGSLIFFILTLIFFLWDIYSVSNLYWTAKIIVPFNLTS